MDWTPQELIDLRQRVAELEMEFAAEHKERDGLWWVIPKDCKIMTHEGPWANIAVSVGKMMEQITRLTAERDEARKTLRWHVRHIQSHAVVAAFEYWDIAKAYIARGYEIGHWKPHELELIDAQALTRHSEKKE